MSTNSPCSTARTELGELVLCLGDVDLHSDLSIARFNGHLKRVRPGRSGGHAVSGEPASATSVGGGFFDFVDDQDVDGSADRVELQAKLLLDGAERFQNWPFKDTVKRAVRSFLYTGRALGSLLIWVVVYIPFMILFYILYRVLRRLVRRNKQAKKP